MKLVEYCQQIKHLKMPLEDIYKELDERPIKRYVAMVHDKDILKDGTHKEDHLHIMMELQSNQNLENVARWFNDEPQYFEKPKTKGKFAYNNMISYLFHLTDSAIDDGKYQYEVSESKANFNVTEMIKIITSETGAIKLKQAQLLETYEKIMNNEIPHTELENYFTNQEWLKNYKQIETCYKIRNAKIAKRMEESKDMNVIYLTGQPGTGKTTYGKIVAKYFGYHFYVTSSGSDPLGEYDGQECIILDDLRKENFSYSELLKFLDNNTHSYVKSRYNNKCPYNCKLLVITSIFDPYELYQDYLTSGEISEGDSQDQLLRRITTLGRFTDDCSKIKLYERNTLKNKGIGEDFILESTADNPVPNYVESMKKHPKLTTALLNLKLEENRLNHYKDFEEIERQGMENEN